MKLRMPDGLKILGCNIVPRVEDVHASGGSYAWPLFWQHFQRDWISWVKPQIDYMVGNSVGVNCQRIIGANWAVPAGQLTQADYDRDVMQYIDYCASLGVYVYLCTGGKDGTTGTVISNAAMAENLAITLRQAQQRPNVIGVDLMQEAPMPGLPSDATLIDLIARLKGLGITLPLTCSTNEQTVTPTAGGTWIDVMGQYFDFIDWHCYSFPPSMQQLAYLRNRFPGKDAIIGETGKLQTASIDEQDRDLTAALRLAMSGDPYIRGALIWAATDQDTDPANMLGCYTDAFVPRYNRLRVIRQFTGGSLVKSLALR